MKNSRTKQTDIDALFKYLDKNGATYTVDRNPSKEKISLIKEAIRKGVYTTQL